MTTRTKAWARGTVALSATDAGLAPIGVVNEHQFGDAHVFTMDFNTGFSAHLMPCAGWSGSMQECPAKTDARAFAIGTHGPSFKVVAVAVPTARRKSGLSGRSRSGLLIPTGFRWPPGRASCSASARGSPSPRSSTERASPHRSVGEPRGGTLPSPGRGRPDAATLGSPRARTRWERRGSDVHQSDPDESIQSGRAPRSNAPD